MPQVGAENEKEANWGENSAGFILLYFEIMQGDVRIPKESLLAQLIYVSAIKTFVDTERAHLGPFWLRMQQGEFMRQARFF